ncbi:MAG: FeoB small GTPase domain-containing protein, partial [Peptostreptococcales bacterium]
MGLTKKSTGSKILLNDLDALKTVSEDSCIIALTGNPNVGKSSIFNILTGLKQHTGNWPGKTVTTAYGHYKYKDKDFIIVDLPGTYSLLSNSSDEEIARNFICFSPSHLTVIVVDATCVERNLNLVLQIIEMNSNVLVCVNLIDEAERKNIKVNIPKLSEKLGVPVVATSASKKTGIDLLKQEILNFTSGPAIASPLAITYDASLEHALSLIYPRVSELTGDRLNCKWVCLKLLDYDESIIQSIDNHLECNLWDDLELKESLQSAKDYLKEQGIHLEYIKDRIASNIISISQSIAEEVVTFTDKNHRHLDNKVDNILTSKKYGIPIMIF